MNTHVFTIAAANYLPKVRVLFRSIRKWHPTWKLHLAIADITECPVEAAEVDADEVHALHELAIPNWRPWAFSHTLIELATAIKPFVLRQLLRRPTCDAAIYFDPDIAVFSPLPEIADALAGHDIVLTPHLTSAEQSIEGVIANELCTLQHGIYNLGFIGVAARPQGRAFAEWWADRLYHFCREDIASGIYTDQRWIDLVPAFFDRVSILRSPRLNVAPWNISLRRLAGTSPTAMTVDGTPLGFYHFSQVDTGAHDDVLSSRQAAAMLTEWYRRKTGRLPTTPQRWGLGSFTSGEAILPEQRLVYRLRRDLQRLFPDPFRTGPGSYLAWWKSYARRDFPALFRADRKAEEIRWLHSSLGYGRSAAEIASEFAPERAQPPWPDEQEITAPRAFEAFGASLFRGGMKLLGLSRS